MNIVDCSYHEFPNEQILSLVSYYKSSKRMSFSFRDGKENQQIFAYASLKKDKINGKVGCRILDFQNNISLANERFFDRIESVAQMWQENGKNAFSCLWFYTKDISETQASIMLNFIEGFEYDEKSKAYIKFLHNEEIVLQ